MQKGGITRLLLDECCDGEGSGVRFIRFGLRDFLAGGTAGEGFLRVTVELAFQLLAQMITWGVIRGT